MVPAVTINPALNLFRAKFLAAASVSNVLVKRGCRRLDSVPSVGTSKLTYQVCFMLRLPPLSVACPPRGNDKKKPPPGRTGDGFFLARDPPKNPLPPHSDAIDAAVCIATSVMTHRSACHRTRPKHDACARNAACRIFSVLAVHDRTGWRWIESETCKPQQCARSDPRSCR